MDEQRYNMSMRKYLKEVGVTSQQEIERVVREEGLEGKGKLASGVEVARLHRVEIWNADDLRYERDFLVGRECKSCADRE